MIHLLDIELTDFMSVEHLQMEFSANETKMISGDNGAGKSALFNAVALVWIEYRKGDSYKDFIRTGCEEAHIIHNALLDGEPIHFDITISNDKYATPLIRKIEYKGRTYNNSECTALFQTFDMEYLEHIMFLFQRDNSIVTLKSGERAKLLKRLFHFEFEAQVAGLKARLTSEQIACRDNELRLEGLMERKFIEQDILPIAPEADRLAAEAELQRIDMQLAKLGMFDSSQLTSCRIALRDTQGSIADQEKLMRSLAVELASLNLQLQETQALALPTPPTVGSVDAAQSVVDNLRTASFEKEHQEKALRSRLSELQNHLKLAEAGHCAACDQEITENLVEKFRLRLQEAQSGLPALEAECDRLAREFQDSVAVLNTCKQVWKDYDATVQNIQLRKAGIQRIQDLITAKSAALVTAEATRDAYSNKALELKDRLAALEAVESQMVERDRLLQEKADLQGWLDERNQCIAVNNDRMEANHRLREEQEQHAVKVAELAQAIADATISMETLKRAISILETEFPNFIILQTCGQIEAYINEVIQKVFPYMQVQLKPNRGGVEFYYTPDSTSGRWLSVKMASGAQAAILSLAWRVAIAKLYGVTTILLDEIDADCTDENSRLLYEFVASLDVFNQIILISHRKEALRAVSALADNVTCYWVSAGGVYTEIADPDSI